MIYTCENCGKKFDVMGKAKICPECRIKKGKCIICGNEFELKYPYTTKTCSRECSGKYRMISGISKRSAAKSIETKMQRYGNKTGSKYKPRICKLCGKEFTPQGSAQVYCKEPHYGPCPVCGKPTLITEPWIGRARACSEECRVTLITKLAQERDNTESVEKYKQTCLERYGVENYSQTSEWYEKVSTTSNATQGGIGFASEEHRNKVKETVMKKYGVDNAAKAEEVKEKGRKTLEERYGGMGAASPILREKAHATLKERYGVDSPMQHPQILAKQRATTRERYGADTYTSTKEGLAMLMLDSSKIDEFWEFRKDPKTYISVHYEEKPFVDRVASDLGVNETSIYDILINHNCKDIVDRSRTSIIEREMHEFLLELVPKEEIIWVDRRTITPLELDFYLPNYKFAIECNPTYTHNSSLPSFNDDAPKSTVYHRNKTQLCEEKGIFLMHIFGYDWTTKQDIIKSMIRNILKKDIRHIYARNTYIKELDAKSTREFLNTNHRQGDASSPIRLGLFTKAEDELVSVMTFSKKRTTIGKKKEDPQDAFELVRFCNLLNTSVIGAASKLFKYFVNNYNPQTITSFSDRAHTKGNLYPTLGFEKERITDPGYVWVNIYSEEYKSRVSCQKHKLPQLFDDVTEEDMQTKSESDIMVEHGFARVFDSGNIVWTWNK